MNKKMRTLVSIVFVIFLTIFFHYLGWLSGLENFLRSIITPVSQEMYDWNINIQNREQQFSTLEEWREAYFTLKEEFLKNKIDSTQKKLLEDENNELREQLSFLQKKSWQTVGAEVIGKNIDTLGNTIIINRGEDSDLQVGNPVIVNQGILVGTIAKVQEKTSVIRLINDNQSKIAATVINKDKSLGLVEGGYGISVYLNYIPQNEIINVGDSVVSSGLEEKIPKGLLIGRVETVEKEAYQPFQNAILTPFFDLNKIFMVSVIISN